MKKLIALLLVTCLLAGCAKPEESPSSSKASSTPPSSSSPSSTPVATGARNIPKTATAPTIDGTKDGTEWNNALEVDISKDKMMYGLDKEDKNSKLGDSKIYFMWDDAGLYYLADVTDGSKPASAPAFGGPLNSGDGIQLNVYASGTSEYLEGTQTMFFSMHPKTSNGQADSYEHFTIKGQLEGAQQKATFGSDGTSYVLEGMIPWSVFIKAKVNGYQGNFNGEAGQSIWMMLVIMDMNGSQQYLLSDTQWATPSQTNEYVLAA